ncbi:S8 family peptidase [Polaribacter porphyrae]|uniref:Peptidase S8 n=1 Tax=Polaribacter porphyrae TaxID=1137780 RepID=A0A2S7WRZ7_9FLAO|nr:S8 family peptidase [Polaribacter porphyrae]PQJ80373.1 peptidase S8 [Polaribacter porphyrae]
MKNLKTSIFVAITSIILSGCGATKVAVNPPTFENIIATPAKKIALSDEALKTWHHLDITTDSIAGISLAKAYKFLEGKKGKPVVVAIADSGVDIEHEDLKNLLWTNKNEIKGNNKDDDKNGYIDDIHGWNFLGNAKGDIVNADQLEITRLVKKGRLKFDGKKASEITEADKEAYQEYLKLDKEYKATIVEKKTEMQQMQQTLENLKRVQDAFDAVKKIAKKDTLTVAVLEKLKPTKLQDVMLVNNVKNILNQGGTEAELVEYKKNVVEYKEYLEKAMKGYDFDLNVRQNLGDDLYDVNDKFYGNNNVIGSKDLEMHGTHVAGIVAANRNNNKGAVGVTNNVKIMAVRIVPDGDEHDKDVALGIRYAVDNGAKIINTSFGKRFSPNAAWVYEALKYAAEKDVLIVNAAGNDGKNIDVRKSFPSDSKDLITEFTDNVITIGASSLHYNEKLPADFTNYGKINVDVFAPGVDIYSTIPKDEYEPQSGTSMAAPATSGVAALIRSYYPNLSAKEVKYILMNSGVKINFEVIKPGSQNEKNPEGKMVPFSELSVSGRVVNAYNALQLADYLSNKK